MCRTTSQHQPATFDGTSPAHSSHHQSHCCWLFFFPRAEVCRLPGSVLLRKRLANLRIKIHRYENWNLEPLGSPAPRSGDQPWPFHQWIAHGGGESCAPMVNLPMNNSWSYSTRDAWNQWQPAICGGFLQIAVLFHDHGGWWWTSFIMIYNRWWWWMMVAISKHKCFVN